MSYQHTNGTIKMQHTNGQWKFELLPPNGKDNKLLKADIFRQNTMPAHGSYNRSVD